MARLLFNHYPRLNGVNNIERGKRGHYKTGYPLFISNNTSLKICLSNCDYQTRIVEKKKPILLEEMASESAGFVEIPLKDSDEVRQKFIYYT